MSENRIKALFILLLLCFSSTDTDALGPPFNALGGIGGSQKKCDPSVTTASGDYVNHKGRCNCYLICECRHYSNNTLKVV